VNFLVQEGLFWYRLTPSPALKTARLCGVAVPGPALWRQVSAQSRSRLKRKPIQLSGFPHPRPTEVLPAAVLVGDARRVQGPFGSAETGPYQAAHLGFECGEVGPEDS
jgi:hypothetical protein